VPQTIDQPASAGSDGGGPPPIGPPRGGERPGGRRFPAPSRLQIVLTAVAVVVLATAGTVAVVTKSSTTSPANALPASQVNLMGLTNAGNRVAPDVTLTDQHGAAVSLASLRGKAVVLEFMDPHCTDICPIISQELVDAYRDLGPSASKVAFVAVNVNPYYTSRAAVATFTAEHGLDHVPTWHFLTGPVAALRTAWSSYGVTVEPRGPNLDVLHSSLMYFIDASGHERWLANPTDSKTPAGTGYLPPSQITQWGHDIAAVSRQLLPA